MDWFDDGVFSSRVQLVKPQPAIFRAASQRFGLAPGELVFIDDLAHHVDAARALGWQAIHFNDARDCEAALTSPNPG
jgi:putative hydrolase of the HAD superfamily